MNAIAQYTTQLNEGNAYWMARIASEVYTKVSDTDPSPDEGGILKSLQADDSGFMSVVGANKNSAQAALIEHKDYLCMAFRGTDQLADWLDNLDAFPTEELFGEFHRGFWKSTEDVWDVIWQAYKDRISVSKRPLFITGHSLGGAMATIAAARLVHHDLPFTSVYTFGQPRALTRETARIFNAECSSRFYRFHNNNDLVTRVPARLMGYSHVGSYLYITEEKTIHREAGFWFRFVDGVSGAYQDAKEKGIDGIKDHDMKEYLSAVEKWDCAD